MKALDRHTIVKFLGLVVVALAFAVAAARWSPAAATSVDQPHMQEALKSLEAAKHHLEKAAADKGGHRAKAIEHVDAAISETKAGIDFDRKH